MGSTLTPRDAAIARALMPAHDPSLRDALYRDLVRLVGARYWPSGRRITARDRRRIARFLVEVFG